MRDSNPDWWKPIASLLISGVISVIIANMLLASGTDIFMVSFMYMASTYIMFGVVRRWFD